MNLQVHSTHWPISTQANMARAALEMAPDLTQDVWKEGLGPAAKAFCKALLHKDPSKRLGSNGVKDILDHAFFGGLDLDEVLADAVQPCVEIEFRAPYAIDAMLIYISA